jgi:hypothetical protein
LKLSKPYKKGATDKVDKDKKNKTKKFDVSFSDEEDKEVF